MVYLLTRTKKDVEGENKRVQFFTKQKNSLRLQNRTYMTKLNHAPRCVKIIHMGLDIWQYQGF